MIFFRTLRQPVLPRWFQTRNPTSPPQVPTRRRRLSKNLPTLNPMNQLQALTRKKRQSKDLLTPNRTLPPQARTKKRLLSKSHLMGISGMRRKPKGSLLSEWREIRKILTNLSLWRKLALLLWNFQHLPRWTTLATWDLSCQDFSKLLSTGSTLIIKNGSSNRFYFQSWRPHGQGLCWQVRPLCRHQVRRSEEIIMYHLIYR